MALQLAVVTLAQHIVHGEYAAVVRAPAVRAVVRPPTEEESAAGTGDVVQFLRTRVLRFIDRGPCFYGEEEGADHAAAGAAGAGEGEEGDDDFDGPTSDRAMRAAVAMWLGVACLNLFVQVRVPRA